MRSLNRAIDRFCYKHPGFGIPNLMLFIVIGNAIVYLFDMMSTTATSFSGLLAFSAPNIMSGEIWRLVTFVFAPLSSRGLLFFALFLYLYYFIGSTLEREWGTGRFTFYYLSGMLLSVIYGFLMYFLGSFVFLDASYINLSMFFAFAALFPDMRLMLFFIIPVKMKWLALIDGAFFLWEIITGTFPSNLVPLIALLNFFIYCGGDLIDMIRPSRPTKQAINFKQAAKKVNKETKNKPYNRKCAVCGRTDTEFPDLEFRYCSRCEGYHCFCIDHINNHVHFDR